jgi:hypothetical protein
VLATSAIFHLANLRVWATLGGFHLSQIVWVKVRVKVTVLLVEFDLKKLENKVEM